MTDKLWHKPDEKPIYHKWVCVKYPKAPVRPVCKYIEEDTYISYACEYAYLGDLITQADKTERLQKAVDFAIDYLEQVATHAKAEEDNFAAQVIKRKIDEIKQLIKVE